MVVAGKILTGWVVVIRTDIGILMGNSVIDVSKEVLVRISQPVCLHFISLLITADRICFRDSSGIQNLNGSLMFPTSHVQNSVCDSELCRPQVGIHKFRADTGQLCQAHAARIDLPHSPGCKHN